MHVFLHAVYLNLYPGLSDKLINGFNDYYWFGQNKAFYNFHILYSQPLFSHWSSFLQGFHQIRPSWKKPLIFDLFLMSIPNHQLRFFNSPWSSLYVGHVNQGIFSSNTGIFNPVDSTFVRPQLEYHAQAWSSSLYSNFRILQGLTWAASRLAPVFVNCRVKREWKDKSLLIFKMTSGLTNLCTDWIFVPWPPRDRSIIHPYVRCFQAITRWGSLELSPLL